jgi:hypothetical protein
MSLKEISVGGDLRGILEVLLDKFSQRDGLQAHRGAIIEPEKTHTTLFAFGMSGRVVRNFKAESCKFVVLYHNFQERNKTHKRTTWLTN